MADEVEPIGEPEEETVAPELPKVNYASNSYKERDKSPKTARSDQGPPEKKLTKVIEGEAVQRKKPLGKKFVETFSGENMHDVGEYILFDVLAPGVKDLIFQVFTQSLERKFYGSSRANRISAGAMQAGQTVMRTAYNRMSSPLGRAGQPDNVTDISRRGRATHDFNEIVIADRGQAEQVLDTLIELVNSYGTATVYDLYELVGITGDFPDQRWGWNDLRASSVDRVRNGYLLNLPKPKPID